MCFEGRKLDEVVHSIILFFLVVLSLCAKKDKAAASLRGEALGLMDPGESPLPSQNGGLGTFPRTFLTCHTLSYCGAHLSGSNHTLSEFLEFTLGERHFWQKSSHGDKGPKPNI